MVRSLSEQENNHELSFKLHYHLSLNNFAFNELMHFGRLNQPLMCKLTFFVNSFRRANHTQLGYIGYDTVFNITSTYEMFCNMPLLHSKKCFDPCVRTGG